MKQKISILILIMYLNSCQEAKEKIINKSQKVVENNITSRADSSTNEKVASNVSAEVLMQKERRIQQDSLVARIDDLMKSNKLTKYFYPNMSGCGGALYGYYENAELKLIDARYEGELGYSSRKIYWGDNKILKIIYREYFPEWDKYEKRYPSDKYEWNSTKMTYTDTLVQITLGKNFSFVKSSSGKIISTDKDSILIERLIDCGFEMKEELKKEKEIKK